ncbi:MAG: hypothetical protein EBS05_14060 [Proteobacteria bacterium]|nr:hypothetical protein [Pseudomonadota bacterium]NDD40840.1 hypothetical protein [Verrucomicrobiota bacterium]NDF01349.1 hypothetical protein [Verrucomicrobiota bacterium]
MGLLDFFSGKKDAPALDRLPSGSFTVDRDGKVLTSTLPSGFPEATLRDIGRAVVEAMVSAREANLPVTELVIHFSGLKITAKEQRGGAMIFLAPIR